MKKSGFPYHYGILKENYKELAQETTIVPSPFKNSKYALIVKQCNDDGTEEIYTIFYSDRYMRLLFKLTTFISWYDYVCGNYKDMQQNVCKLA